MIRLISEPVVVPFLGTIFLFDRGEAFGFEELDEPADEQVGEIWIE